MVVVGSECYKSIVLFYLLFSNSYKILVRVCLVQPFEHKITVSIKKSGN
jgi:hypothetical protein